MLQCGCDACGDFTVSPLPTDISDSHFRVHLSSLSSHIVMLSQNLFCVLRSLPQDRYLVVLSNRPVATAKPNFNQLGPPHHLVHSNREPYSIAAGLFLARVDVAADLKYISFEMRVLTWGVSVCR